MSETDFLKLKKHDNVETNTEKFDIENYLNGNWDKINENAKEVNTNISNINSKDTELEKELKEAQEDFYQNSIRGQASGEYIHVEDSSNCRCRIGISGNSEQETRSGKNYLNTLAKYKSGDTVTIEGITYTFNNDGSITCNGTASADSILDISQNIQTISGTNKKIVGLLTGSQVPANVRLTAFTSDWGKNPIITFSEVNKSLTSNMIENAEYTIFRLMIYNGTTVNNQTVYYQILDASETDLTYEQYGASPSPDYPSQIQAVGSNVNYYDKSKEVIGEAITTTGTTQKLSNWTHSDFIEVNSNEVISITCENKANGQFMINEYDANKKIIKASVYDFRNTTADNKYTITTTSTTKYIIAQYRNDLNMNNIMVVKGSEVLPYNQNCNGMGAVKVTKCNKNLFDKNTTTDGKLISSSGSIQAEPAGMCSDYIQIKTSANYYISGRTSLSSIALYDKNKTFLERISTTQPNGVLNITNSNCKYIIINALLTNKDTLQIEEETTTPFEQHKEQSYIMPVQKEMLEDDYFDWDNEEEVHTWNKLVLDGTEDGWLKREVASEECRFEFPLSVVALNNNQTINILCDKLKGLTADATYLKQEGISASTWVQIYLKEFSRDKTVEDFKKWLKEHPLTIYYKLATPERLKFTNEQKEVAKELNNARTYKNVTNITTDSKAILDLDYVKNQEIQNQKMQNEIDEIKQLLSTTQTSALLLDNMQTDIESEVE